MTRSLLGTIIVYVSVSLHFHHGAKTIFPLCTSRDNTTKFCQDWVCAERQVWLWMFFLFSVGWNWKKVCLTSWTLISLSAKCWRPIVTSKSNHVHESTDVKTLVLATTCSYSPLITSAESCCVRQLHPHWLYQLLRGWSLCGPDAWMTSSPG